MTQEELTMVKTGAAIQEEMSVLTEAEQEDLRSPAAWSGRRIYGKNG